MIRQFTGNTFTPQEFRELNQCVYCGKAEKIKYGGTCELCSKIDYKKCEICDIVLRKGEYKFYSYDIKEYKREDEVDFKPNKQLVKEFERVEQFDNIENEHMCTGCKDWEKDMKDICWKCDNDFDNNKQNYKLNGNMCEECSQIFQ